MTLDEQVDQARRLAHKMRLTKYDGVLGSGIVRDWTPGVDITEANFEIKYMLACSELGFTDQAVLMNEKRFLGRASHRCN